MRSKRLTVDEQVDILARVWDEDHEPGYVFLPWIKGDTSGKEERRKNYHEGKAFPWPAGRDQIREHLNAHPHDDVYFCPMVFNKPHRTMQLADREIALWADLDPIDPRKNDKLQRFKPTIAWETSPGRFQAIWILEKALVGAAEDGGVNHRLSYWLDADRSGWDITQLLRVPGRRNHKPEYRDEDGASVPGRLLWSDGPTYDGTEFNDLPPVGSGEHDDELIDELLEAVDRAKVWKRVRLKVSQNVREYVAFRGTDIPDGTDRSEVLWQIERDLADAGCTLAEIVAIVRPLVWNKYTGRADELRYLKNEAAKAIAEKEEVLEEVDEEIRDQGLDHYWDVEEQIDRKVNWLIKDVLAEGGCAFIAADPKHYKSWIALDLMASIVSGTPFLNEFHCSGQGRKVLYISEEDGASVIVDRWYEVMDEKYPQGLKKGYMTYEDDQLYWHPGVRLEFYEKIRKGFISTNENWQAWLGEQMSDYELDLVVIDTLFSTAQGVDIDRGGEITDKMLNPLRKLAEEHNCAVLIVHHNKKSKQDGRAAGQNMLGSAAIHAWVETGIYIWDKTNEPHLHSVEGSPGGVILTAQVESKTMADQRFTISIPRMHRRYMRQGRMEPDQHITSWKPVVSWLMDEDEKQPTWEAVANASPRKGKKRKVVNQEPVLIQRMKDLGATKFKDRVSVADIAERTGVTPQTIRTQVRKAQAQGLIKFKSDGYWITNS